MDPMTCPHCRRPADRPLFLPRSQQQVFDFIWNNPWSTIEEIERGLYGSAIGTNLAHVQISKIGTNLMGTAWRVGKRNGPNPSGHRPQKQYAIEQVPTHANL